MSSVGDRIVDNITASLGVNSFIDPATGDPVNKPAGLATDRFRVQQLKSPGAYPYRTKEAVKPAGMPGGRLVVRQMAVRVEVRADGDIADQATDPISVWVIRRVMADPTQGGLATSTMEVAAEWSGAAATTPIGAVVHDFVVTYQTRADNPELQA